MRIILISLAAITSVLAIIMAILPFGTIGILPSSIAICSGLVAYYMSTKQKKPKKLALLFTVIGVITIVTSSTKSLWIKDELAEDQEFIQKEEQSEKDAIKDLKEIENDLEDIEIE